MRKLLKIVAGTFSVLLILVPLSDGLLSIYSHFFPTTSDTQKHDIIVGSWNTDYSYSGSGVTISIDGVTTYFSNGKYNFHGFTTISGETGEESFSLTSLTDAAGTWDLYDKELIISQNDIKSLPSKLFMNGKDLDPKYVERVTHQELPRIGSDMANGKSQSYKILSYNDNTIELEVINTVGENFKTIITRK